MAEPTQQFTLSELCILADLPVRTLRYYVQNGLVDHPEPALCQGVGRCGGRLHDAPVSSSCVVSGGIPIVGEGIGPDPLCFRHKPAVAFCAGL